jgi:hypothetical protein
VAVGSRTQTVVLASSEDPVVTVTAEPEVSVVSDPLDAEHDDTSEPAPPFPDEWEDPNRSGWGVVVHIEGIALDGRPHFNNFLSVLRIDGPDGPQLSTSHLAVAYSGVPTDVIDWFRDQTAPVDAHVIIGDPDGAVVTLQSGELELEVLSSPYRDDTE